LKPGKPYWKGRKQMQGNYLTWRVGPWQWWGRAWGSGISETSRGVEMSV